jgi:hypothetical protein
MSRSSISTTIGASGIITPLPVGAATEAAQNTGNNSLNDLNSKFTETTIGGVSGTNVIVVGSIDNYVRGAQAHDQTMVGGPVVAGAVGLSTEPTDVTDGNVTALWSDQKGRLHVTGDANAVAIPVSTGLPASENTGDGVTSASSGLRVLGVNYLVDNAGNINRQKQILDATNFLSTGLPATPIMAVLDEASITTTTENQWSAVRMTAGRSLHVNLRDANYPGVATFTTPAAMADTFTNPTVTGIRNHPMVWNGVTWDRQTSVATAADQLGNGIIAVGMYCQVDDSVTKAIAEGNYGPPRLDSTTRGMATGGIARTANPTAKTNGDAMSFMVDKLGRLPHVGAHVRDMIAHQYTQIVNSTVETTFLSAAGANVFADITALIINTQSNVDTTCTIKDSTTGTTRLVYTLHNAGNNAGGLVVTFPTPVKQATANNNWTITLSNNTSTVDVFVQYAKNL